MQVKKTSRSIPASEADEQKAFVEWLEVNRYKFSAIPNATWTSFSQQRKNKAEGVRPGLPDLLVIVKNQLVWIEMKKSIYKNRKNGGLSEAQMEWRDALNDCANCQVFVAYGYSEAVDIIKSIK